MTAAALSSSLHGIHLFRSLLLISVWSTALVWLFVALRARRGMKQIPDVSRIPATQLPPLPENNLPHLSVLVPACNEEENIQATLRSLLASTNIRLEILAINDRSTDQTGDRMDEVAAEAAGTPHRLTVIHNEHLPSGWLGKPHAISLGVAQATAPWMLLTDGDIRFHPEVLNRTLRLALRQQTDHLVLIPTLDRRSLGSRAAESTAHAFSMLSLRMWKVADPKARDFMGVGGFNMVRSAAWQQINAPELLRMEVLEDMALGFLIKKNGLHSMIAQGHEMVRLHWIEGWLGIIGNVTKNGFAVFRYRPLPALLVCTAVLMQALAPLLALAAGPWGIAACLLTYLSLALTYQTNRRMSGLPPWLCLCFAPAAMVQSYALLRSAWLTLRHGGITWRGSFYPLNELRRKAVPML